MVDYTLPALILGLAFGSAYGIFMGWVKFDIYRWVSLKRKFGRKNWGIAFFRSYGKTLYPVVKDFNADVIKTKSGIWILNKGKIYRQVKDESVTEKDIAIDIKGNKLFGRLERKIDPDTISFRGGIPVIFFDADDMLPLKFESEPFVAGQSRNPAQVESTINKEISSAEAEAVKMTKKNIQKLLIVVAILAGIGAVFGILSLVFNDSSKILNMLTIIHSDIQNMQITTTTIPQIILG